MGLCYRCGVKWSKDHKCAPQVQLNVVQELSDLLQPEEPELNSDQDVEDQVFLALSQYALTGATVRLIGDIQGLSVTMLLDSGSSTSFISETLASQLKQVHTMTSPCTVRVAGGGILKSSVRVHNLQWSVGQCIFHSYMRVLPLNAFDVIIGMDWLESFSPMQVYWKHKWPSIPYVISLTLQLNSCFRFTQ